MMDGQRIAQIEKELASMQATVHPLVNQIKESTTAMTRLTNEISLLVQSNTYMQKSFDETKVVIVENTKRIVGLEKSEEVRKSSDVVMIWVKRTVTVGIVAAVLGLILIK